MNFEYISSSEPGLCYPTEWDDELEGCKCLGKQCTASEGCSCLIGSEDNYTEDGLLLPKPSGAPILECHYNCHCSEEKCCNRLLQRGIKSRIKVIRTDAKGYGVIALETITSGSFICEYAGEVVTREDVERRVKEAQEKKEEHNYIMTLKEHCGDSTTYTYIDPRKRGNLARFINHSCSPNCELVAVRVGRAVPLIGLFAIRDIVKNEEILYDYGSSEICSSTSDLKMLPKKCLCGSENCRGILPMSYSSCD